MSCGKPHETPCTEVLDGLYSYLDGELEPPTVGKIRQHLEDEECGPCLEEYGLDELVKKLVHDHCGHERVPDELRAKVLVRIRQIRVELNVTEITE
jgi:mycothiol system anti-sigma-R factor